MVSAAINTLSLEEEEEALVTTIRAIKHVKLSPARITSM